MMNKSAFLSGWTLYRTLLLSVCLLLAGLLWADRGLCQPWTGADSEIFSQHNAIMLLIEPQSGDIVDANPAAAAFYGYTVDELRRMRIQQINTLTAEEILQERLRAVRDKNNYFIFRHRLASGEERTVEVHSSHLLIGGQMLLLSIINDVTRREGIQAELARDEARLRYAEQVAGFGHWVYDLDKEVYQLSAGAQQILGLEGEHWTDDEIRSLYLPEHRQRIKEARKRLIEQGIPYDLQMQLNRATDGRLLDVHSIATYDPEKRQVFGIVEDVTVSATAMREVERQSRTFARWMSLAVVVQLAVIALLGLAVLKLRRAKQRLAEREASLREHTEMTRLLLDSTAEAIYGIDLQGNCTFCNAASLRLLGYQRPEQLLGRNMHALIHHSRADGRPHAATDCLIFKALVNLKGTHVDDEVFWRADGSSFPAEYWSYPIFRDGELLGAVVTFLDITARRRAEESLLEKNAELERFTYTASHDLKSPLVTIITFLGYLQQDLASGDRGRIEKDIFYMRTAAEKMQRLIDDLLDFSRIGRVANAPEKVTLQQLAEDACGAVAGRIAQRGVQVSIAGADITLIGDRQRLGEIWQNLVDNAVKYMGEQGAPRIEVGVEQRDGDTVFFVRDNGAGVEPRYHEKIFNLFEKLDPHSEGTGLGLAMVNRLVRQNGGRIWVESEGQGRGSCFRFTLPEVPLDQGSKGDGLANQSWTDVELQSPPPVK